MKLHTWFLWFVPLMAAVVARGNVDQGVLQISSASKDLFSGRSACPACLEFRQKALEMAARRGLVQKQILDTDLFFEVLSHPQMQDVGEPIFRGLFELEALFLSRQSSRDEVSGVSYVFLAQSYFDYWASLGEGGFDFSVPNEDFEQFNGRNFILGYHSWLLAFLLPRRFISGQIYARDFDGMTLDFQKIKQALVGQPNDLLILSAWLDSVQKNPFAVINYSTFKSLDPAQIGILNAAVSVLAREHHEVSVKIIKNYFKKSEGLDLAYREMKELDEAKQRAVPAAEQVTQADSDPSSGIRIFCKRVIGFLFKKL
jgi:hypothetical protein